MMGAKEEKVAEEPDDRNLQESQIVITTGDGGDDGCQRYDISGKLSARPAIKIQPKDRR